MRFFAGLLTLWLSAFTGATLWAGGSGLNVIVVVNQNSTNSVQLGNYYCEKRGVPPQNLLRTSWSGGNIAWQKSDFESVILTPLLSMLSARQLTNQADYVLLSMDFPYRVQNGGGLGTAGTNSTTSALFYGFKVDYPPNFIPGSCSLPAASVNPYAASESVFRWVAPGINKTNFLAVMLTSSNLAQAKLVVDHAVAGDATFPTQTVILAKSTDVSRNIRYLLFDNAIFNARLRGDYSVQTISGTPTYYLGSILGFQTGWGNRYVLASTSFVPGSLADNLTSYGGCLFDPGDQLSIIALLNAGAAGTYGTVIEPCAYLAKFPSPQVFFYQGRGFGMAECYYQSADNPYQGLVLGDPLAAPFALPSPGAWNSLPDNALLSGTTNLSLQLNAPDPARPIGQVDLFVDGIFARTLTNFPPRTNNLLYVTLNGHPTNYTIPAGATLISTVSNLASRLNATSYSNATKVQALAYGDRLELRSLDLSKSGSQLTTSVSNSAGTASVLATFLSASGSNFLDTVAYGRRAYSVSNAPAIGSYLQLVITKTSGGVVTVAITNTVSGTSVSTLTQGLLNMVNTNPALMDADGVVAEDYIGYDPYYRLAEFNLRPRSQGWPAAQIQITLSGSTVLAISPTGAKRLDENLADLQPRNHLYLAAGLTNLPLTFAFNTTTQADGFHELTAVAYEGTSVRTQTRVSRTVRIQNTALSATFMPLFAGASITTDVPIQFSVTANNPSISRIELFSTGGSIGVALNQSSVVFTAPTATLGLGLHPFYAVVTDTGGHYYQTQTEWVRLVTPISPFKLTLSGTPLKLSWPATIGLNYDVLTTTNLATSFQPLISIVASNTTVQWPIPAPAGTANFFRVRYRP